MVRHRSDLFRDEALRHHRAGEEQGSDVLRISPSWINAGYWLLVAVVAAAIACVATIPSLRLMFSHVR